MANRSNVNQTERIPSTWLEIGISKLLQLFAIWVIKGKNKWTDERYVVPLQFGLQLFWHSFATTWFEEQYPDLAQAGQASCMSLQSVTIRKPITVVMCIFSWQNFPWIL